MLSQKKIKHINNMNQSNRANMSTTILSDIGFRCVGRSTGIEFISLTICVNTCNFHWATCCQCRTSRIAPDHQVQAWIWRLHVFQCWIWNTISRCYIDLGCVWWLVQPANTECVVMCQEVCIVNMHRSVCSAQHHWGNVLQWHLGIMHTEFVMLIQYDNHKTPCTLCNCITRTTQTIYIVLFRIKHWIATLMLPYNASMNCCVLLIAFIYSSETSTQIFQCTAAYCLLIDNHIYMQPPHEYEMCGLVKPCKYVNTIPYSRMTASLGTHWTLPWLQLP